MSIASTAAGTFTSEEMKSVKHTVEELVEMQLPGFLSQVQHIQETAAVIAVQLSTAVMSKEYIGEVAITLEFVRPFHEKFEQQYSKAMHAMVDRTIEEYNNDR